MSNYAFKNVHFWWVFFFKDTRRISDALSKKNWHVSVTLIKYEKHLLFHHVFLFQDLVHLKRSGGALKLLTVQQLIL